MRSAGVVSEIRQWLEDFSAAVRSRDFAAGRALFCDDVIAFGTRASRIEGLDALEAQQWRPTWNSTQGYRFDYDDARIDVHGDIACVAVTWYSQGQNADDQWFDRFGRATYLLRRVEGRWLAFHTHHSLKPDLAARAPDQFKSRPALRSSNHHQL